jgi:hypothetical protein
VSLDDWRRAFNGVSFWPTPVGPKDPCEPLHGASGSLSR